MLASALEYPDIVPLQVGPEEHVICALSGGVDSTVAATLVHKVVGDRLHCVFVDNGLLRFKAGAGPALLGDLPSVQTGHTALHLRPSSLLNASVSSQALLLETCSVPLLPVYPVRLKRIPVQYIVSQYICDAGGRARYGHL